MSTIDWLEHHMLKCPYKMLTGIDCPGCGIQRSFLEMLKGNFTESLSLYPALLPIIFTFIFLVLHLKYKFKNGAKVLQYAFIASTAIVLVSFIIKVSHLPFHR
jgi:hypothetical protein